jgi:hypothetical protein
MDSSRGRRGPSDIVVGSITNNQKLSRLWVNGN